MDAASYTYLRAGGIPDGGVARTVCVGDDINIDLDSQDRVIGVETIGEDADWRDGLARLAMAGRLAVPRAPSPPAPTTPQTRSSPSRSQ